MYTNLFKPTVDFLFALILFLFISPIFIVISLLLFIDLKGTPFFTQERNGYQGKVIRIIKFRTMTNEKDESGNLLPNSDRLTSLGKFIRRLSLDEIPQLVNVLRGEMSFIGPRPLPLRYYPYFNDVERKRFEVLPGISGLAQVSGRNHLMWDKRLGFDVEYVESIGLFVDLKILLLTLKKVIKRNDIAVDPTQVMIDFDTYKKGLKTEQNA